MRQGVRITGAVVAVALVGYAVVMLSRPEPEDVRKRERSEPAVRPQRPARAPQPGQGDAAPASARATRPPPGKAVGVPAPGVVVPPPAPIDFERTLGDFEQFVDELEATDRRGEKLAHEAWVERYKGGSELADALMRAPEIKDGDHQRQVSELNHRFRLVIHKVAAPAPG